MKANKILLIVIVSFFSSTVMAQDNKAPSDKYDQREKAKQRIKENIKRLGIPVETIPIDPRVLEVTNNMDRENQPQSVSPTPTVNYNPPAPPAKKEKPEQIGPKPSKNN